MTKYNRCRICNKPLSDPASMEKGVGPECWAKERVDIEGKGGVDPLLSFLFSEAGNPDVILSRDKNGHVQTNIEHSAVLHSPTGFEWGYPGSGPADLALNILLRYGVRRSAAERYHQRFKEDFLVCMPEHGGQISREHILDWINQHIKESVA